MKHSKLIYLSISRYLTYIIAYIISITLIENNFKSVLLFTLFFIAILCNSAFRIYRLYNKKWPFAASIIFEIIMITYLNISFNCLSLLFLCILIVDIFLFLKLKDAALLSISAYLSLLVTYFINMNSVQLKYLFSEFFSGSLALFFFSAASCIVRKMTLMNDEMEVLNSQLKESKEELEIANARLLDYSEKVEEISILNERNRLAGEIHDTIGHSLTALIMEVDICEKLIDKDIDKTKCELKKAQDLARSALHEVRKSVREIKSTDKAIGINAIKELITNYEKSSGIAVEFDVSKQQYSLSPAVEVTIYRAIQEALTNCAKYGHASNVKIELSFKKYGIELFIKNNGLSCEDIKQGIGLKTMQERVEALGGNINVSGENGFSINVFIPVEVNNE